MSDETTYEVGLREMFKSIGALRKLLDIREADLREIGAREAQAQAELRTFDHEMARRSAAIAQALDRSGGDCISCREKKQAWSDIGLCVECRLDSFKHGMPR